jgi:hypothetical protein
MIGHADANEIISDTDPGEDDFEKLLKYPITLVVGVSFIVGIIFGFITGFFIGFFLA